MVGGDVEHIHGRDLYSAARPSRRNCLMMRVCQRQRRLLWESLRESWVLQPFTCAFLNFFMLTFRALGAQCHDFGHDSRMTSCLKYTVSQRKVPTFTLSVTTSNLNRFSKLLHYWKACEVCYKMQTTLPTSP